MKTIKILTFTACCFLISFYSFSQNLQFNSAVFYEYVGGAPDADNYLDIVASGTLIVGANQVLKITSAGGSAAMCTATAAGFFSIGYVLINEKVIAAPTNIIELYLPQGNYNVGFSDSAGSGSSCSVKGYISGVLYDIVP
jgi:hypothetical protein